MLLLKHQLRGALIYSIIAFMQGICLHASHADMPLKEQLINACHVLNISVDGPFDQVSVTRIFKRKVKETHPDHYNGSAEKAELFKEVYAAYTLIKEHIELGDIERILHPGAAPGRASWRSSIQSPTSAPVTKAQRELLYKLYNCCTLLDVHAGDTIADVHRKYDARMRSYTQDSVVTFAQKVQVTMLQHAHRLLEAHRALVPVVLRDKMKRPVPLTFPSDYIATALHIVQNKAVMWLPTVDYMRCYLWSALIADIRVCLPPEHIACSLVANPYLSSAHVTYTQNPYLQDMQQRAELALDAVHLSVYDLVNMSDGKTDALSELYRTRDELPLFSDYAQRIEHLTAVEQMLVGYGAVARFYPRT